MFPNKEAIIHLHRCEERFRQRTRRVKFSTEKQSEELAFEDLDEKRQGRRFLADKLLRLNRLGMEKRNKKVR